jgi:hypothetical protein
MAQTTLTTTLLPTKTECVPPQSQGKLLRIAANEKNEPISKACLSFDLSVLPVDATINEATLRLVAESGKTRQPQIVVIFPDGNTDSVAKWTATEPDCCAFSSTDLGSTVQKVLQSKTLALTLSSGSRRSDWQYYSMGDYGGTSSNKPRLIVEYTPSKASLDREQVSDTTKTRWTYFKPDNVTVKQFSKDVGTIISNPVFYDGGIYLFAQPTSDKTMLYALYPGGGNRWGPKEIKQRPGSHALVTSAGRLYSIGENWIVTYDLEKEGAVIKSVDLGDFKPTLRPTLAADGSLYATPGGSGYIYGFNPDPQEIWRYRSDNAKLAAASRITLSPGAGRYAYVLSKFSNEPQTHPVRIDTATGSADKYDLPIVKTKIDGKEMDKNLDLGFTGFHRPVAIKGPEQDYVFLSAYTNENGMLLSHSGGSVVWWKEGPVSQPILDKDQNVVAVQKGQVHVYDKFNGSDDGKDKKTCSSTETNVAATSNLVLDGEDNVYFWNSGTLFAYTKGCTKFLESKNTTLPEKLELMFASDGTLYARSEGNNTLFSITPSQKKLNVAQADLKTDTIYAAETIQAGPNLQINSENIILKAENSISFGTGFSVKAGASVLCRIGF